MRSQATTVLKVGVCDLKYAIEYIVKNESNIMMHLTNEFEQQLRKISYLSNKINHGDNKKLLRLIKAHTKEIEELYDANNEHWTIETADLIILCYELLLLENKDIGNVFQECLPRYDKKFKELIQNDL